MKKPSNSNPAAGFGDLPREILLQILVSLPVISILRCTAVSKVWNSLIRSSEFVSHHRSSFTLSSNSNPDRRPSLLLRRLTAASSEHFTLHSDPERFAASSVDISSPFKPRSGVPGCIHVFGSLHGLICLCDNFHMYAYTIYIWNPSLRRFIDVPRPTLNFREMGELAGPNSAPAVLGFGYDSNADDYKVVRIAYPRTAGARRRAEVYALKERQWREVPIEVLQSCDGDILWSQCSVDGIIYWPAKVGLRNNFLLAFDVNDESFSRIELPKELPGAGESRLISISETKVTGLLTVLYYTATSCEILVKQGCSGADNSWARFCSVSIVDPTRELVIGLWQDKEVLLQKGREEDLVGSPRSGQEVVLCLYDHKTRQVELLGMPGAGYLDVFYAADYTESIVLLEPEVCAVSYRDPEVEPIARSVNFDLEDAHFKWCGEQRR
ncbi:unnamed protein product [Linum tenue]|uniref:F-box domain-containing protein n=1 Tax=Linum tenue TaxID=586396 RepID=A0AAV0J895_9ROSI|nr:unnamed protein product [Linum tenue]